MLFNREVNMQVHIFNAEQQACEIDCFKLLNLLLFSLVYFAEKDSVEKWSFFDSFWWGLMVLTTVGYGSTAPSTAAGKVWLVTISLCTVPTVRVNIFKAKLFV
jgi:Ion channel